MPFLKLGEVGNVLNTITSDPWSRAGIIMEPDKYIRSRNYVAGSTGWSLNSDGTGELAGLTLTGDLYSSNWDGGFDLTSKDGTATAGYLLDYDSGSAQFMGDFFLGGDLLVDGTIANGTANSYMVIPASTGAGSVTNPMLTFYSGSGNELSPAKVYTNYAGPFVQLLIDGAQGGAGANYGLGQIILDGSTSAGIIYLIPRGYGTTNASLVIAPTVAGSGTTGVSISADATTITSTVTVSGLIQISSGSSSAPTYSFTSSPASGLYLYATNQIGVAANSTIPAIFKESATGLASGLLGSNYHGATSVLGGTAADRVYVETAGGSVNGNNVYLDTLMIRNVTGSGWGNEAIGLRRRTDATEQASIWFDSSSIGINNSQPTSVTGTLVVNGSASHVPGTTGSAANATYVATTAPYYNLQRSTSSRKYKNRITYKVDYLADKELRPTKHWRIDDKQWRYGFIMEDLQETDPLFVDGETPNQMAILAVLAAKVNRLEKELTQLKSAM